MKTLRKTFAIMMIAVLACNVQQLYAQKWVSAGKKAVEIAKKVIKSNEKEAAKAAEKVVSKGGSYHQVSAAAAREAAQFESVSCPNCSGSGQVVCWNSYYCYYYDDTCPKCNGRGQIVVHK